MVGKIASNFAPGNLPISRMLDNATFASPEPVKMQKAVTADPTAQAVPLTAQGATFPILLSLGFCHLLNDLMQSLLPALYPMLKAEFSAIFGGRRVDLAPPDVMRNPFRRKSILGDLRVLYET